MKPSIYLAASRHDIALAKELMRRLREAGHTITHDWIADIESSPRPKDVTTSLSDHELPDAYLVQCAKSDFMGVVRADLFWLLAPAEGGSGCWIELGMRIMAKQPPTQTIISGAHTRSIFINWTRAEGAKTFDQHEEAFSWVTGFELLSIEEIAARRRASK